MRDILTIAKKELKAIFTNKTLLSQIFAVPFILIFGFMAMSSLLTEPVEDIEEFELKGYVVNMPEFLNAALSDVGLQSVDLDKIEDIKDDIKNGDCHILMVFPEDFKFAESADELSNIEMWHNSSEIDSIYAQEIIVGVLDSLRPVIFTLNADNPEQYDLAEEINLLTEMMELSFPIYSLMGIFLSAMAIAAESIVGDKERGFMNMLLITPTKRTNIAFGKFAVLFIVNLASGLSTLLGMVASILLTNTMGTEPMMSYSFGEYCLLFISAIAGSFAMTSIVMVISTRAKSIKQANSTASFIMTAVMLVGIITTMPMIKDMISEFTHIINCIPIVNSVISMQSIITSNHTLPNVLFAISINIVFAAIMAIYTAKLFEDEKIMSI